MISVETGGILRSLTTSIPQSLEQPEVFDMRYCWLKDAVFTVNALHKIQAIPQMEAYISYLINICILSIKKDLPIETSYALIYNKGRKNEREASNLAGYDVSTSRE